ncbi:hypothetical protein FKM82_031387 [Ascaphus truei]
MSRATRSKRTSSVLTDYFAKGDAGRAKNHEGPAQSGTESEEEEREEHGRDDQIMRRWDMREFCMDIKRCFQSELAALRADLGSIGVRTDFLDRKLDSSIKAQHKTEKQLAQLKEVVRDLTDRQEDSDNRDRRNNVRIRGITEEETDPEDFMGSCSSSWLRNRNATPI